MEGWDEGAGAVGLLKEDMKSSMSKLSAGGEGVVSAAGNDGGA